MTSRPGAVLTLYHDTAVTGGNLTIGDGNELDISISGDGHGATLDGVTVINDGTIYIDPTTSGAILTLATTPASPAAA